MDILEINDLTFKAILGIHPFERQMPQKLVASLSLGVTCKEIAQTDNINNTIDYDILCQKVTQFACDNQCHLLETLAHKLTDFILESFRVPWVKITLSKPGALENVQSVSVTVERHATFDPAQ